MADLSFLDHSSLLCSDIITSNVVQRADPLHCQKQLGNQHFAQKSEY